MNGCGAGGGYWGNLPSPRKLLRGLRWYLAELTGETEYDRYVEHHARTHPGEPVLGRREYERKRYDRMQVDPGTRCC